MMYNEHLERINISLIYSVALLSEDKFSAADRTLYEKVNNIDSPRQLILYGAHDMTNNRTVSNGLHQVPGVGLCCWYGEHAAD